MTCKQQRQDGVVTQDSVLTRVSLTREEAQSLAQIGFLAISRQMTSQATEIFDALRTLKPDQEVGYIGMAAIALSNRQPEDAYTILRAGPPTDAIASFKILALQQSGRTAAARVNAVDLMQTAPDTLFAEMAMLAADQH